jgi:hypothetical protein
MRCAGLSPRNGLGEDRNHGGADMAQVRTWAAFDVHVSGVVAATLDRDSGQLGVQRVPAWEERGSGGVRNGPAGTRPCDL